jgi:hypothetical protein
MYNYARKGEAHYQKRVLALECPDCGAPPGCFCLDKRNFEVTLDLFHQGRSLPVTGGRVVQP